MNVKLALDQRFGAELTVQLALERRFRAPLNVKLAVDRQFSAPLNIKLALDRQFGTKRRCEAPVRQASTAFPAYPPCFFQPGDPHDNTYFTYRKQLFHFPHFCIFGPAVWDTTDGPAGPGTTESSAVERPVGPGPAVLGAFDHFGRTRRQGPLETAVSGTRWKG